MRSRGQSQAHAEVVSRRLAMLSAELNGIREESDPGELVPFPQEEVHTRIRAVEFRPEEPAPEPAAESAAGEEPAGPPPVPRAGRHAAARSGWVDLSAFRGRVALASSHVAVLAVVAAVALAVTTWWVLRDDPGTPVVSAGGGPVLVSGAPTPAGDGSAPASSGAVGPDGSVATTPTEVVVDVSGKVRRPGIVVLPPGSRVVDAIKAAGGVRQGADLTGLNQARVVVDGEQVVVGVPAPPGTAASAAPGGGGPAPPAPGGLVNLNTATASQLEELPGVGPVTAESIVTWRESNGGFRAVDQLLEVDGIGEKTLAQLAPHVTV